MECATPVSTGCVERLAHWVRGLRYQRYVNIRSRAALGGVAGGTAAALPSRHEGSTGPIRKVRMPSLGLLLLHAREAKRIGDISSCFCRPPFAIESIPHVLLDAAHISVGRTWNQAALACGVQIMALGEPKEAGGRVYTNQSSHPTLRLPHKSGQLKQRSAEAVGNKKKKI